MHCPMKFEWVKLLRSRLPEGKGIMGAWAKLAARAAFRKGQAHYCGYTNEVVPGMWSGGIVGLKSILGIKNRAKALNVLETLAGFGYIEYSLDSMTKRLTYSIKDWVVKCSGEECMVGNVYTTEGFGFLCLPRDITERLAQDNYIFEEADAWLDLWCHTVFEDRSNAFSFLAPTVQYTHDGAVLTLETLGRRWGWEKTKVWRFFQKYGDVFALYRLPGSYGCLIFNREYPVGETIVLPEQGEVETLFRKLSGCSNRCVKDKRIGLNRALANNSRRILPQESQATQKDRVALFARIIRAYISPCRDCSKYDCKGSCIGRVVEIQTIRGSCRVLDLDLSGGEFDNERE